MKFDEIAIADGEILQLYCQSESLFLAFQDWQKVIYGIKFKEIYKVITLDFLNEPLDKIVINQSDNFANYQFFGTWENDCVLEIVASQDYEIQISTENFLQNILHEQKAFENCQKIAKAGSRERGLALVKKLQQTQGASK